MNIYFDFELDDNYKGMVQSPSSKAISDEIRNVVIERLKILSDEIEREEDVLSGNNKAAAIIIQVTKHPVKVHYLNYPLALQLKIKKSLEDVDDYLNYRFSGRDNNHNN